MINYNKSCIKAKELRKKGLSYREISKILKIPKDTIFGWISKNKTPNRPRNQKILPSAYGLSEKFGYIMGVMKGDGSIVKSINTIKLTSKDFDFCHKFKIMLEEWSGVKCTNISKTGNLWTVSLSSKSACEIIKSFNISNILIAGKKRGSIKFSLRYF
ncbi:MAG: hypothetical protein ACE5J3_05175 [Methanosarcinales archaeon]